MKKSQRVHISCLLDTDRQRVQYGIQFSRLTFNTIEHYSGKANLNPFTYYSKKISHWNSYIISDKLALSTTSW